MEYVTINHPRYTAPVLIERPAYDNLTQCIHESGIRDICYLYENYPNADDHHLVTGGCALVASDDIRALYGDKVKTNDEAEYRYKWQAGLLIDLFVLNHCARDERGEWIDFHAAAALMDTEICEMLHASFSRTVQNQTFLEAYAVAHECKHGEPFAPYAGLAW